MFFGGALVMCYPAYLLLPGVSLYEDDRLARDTAEAPGAHLGASAN